MTPSFIDLCHPNPCLNGGECFQETATNFKCHCMDGFTGKNCGKKSQTRNFSNYLN